jgi:hypothetical protein
MVAEAWRHATDKRLYRPRDSTVIRSVAWQSPYKGIDGTADLLVFAVLCTLWSALLIFRVVTRDPFSSQAYPFQDVFLGVKFYGRFAHITMAIQATIYGLLGIGILLHQRWGLILGLLYFAQVVIGHVIFFVTNFNVPSQAVQVKIAAIEGPVVFLILLYLWIRSRPLLADASP